MEKKRIWIIIILIILWIILATFFLNIKNEGEGLSSLKDTVSFEWLFKSGGGLPYGYIANTDEGSNTSGGCLEVWECDEWSDCIDKEFRTRKCTENTGCVLYFHKPITNISCNETCLDEIKNQDEEGVDCGGICEPCVNFEWPSFEKDISWLIVALLGLLIITLLILFFIWKPYKKKQKQKKRVKRKRKT